MLGLVGPDDGKFLVEGLPLDRFGHKSYHDQIAAVLQEDVLFAGSLADNIALFDDQPDIDAIVIAAKAASIHEDIEQFPMKYETLVGDMGSTLSGGQKQRILLARALHRKPKLLIMDEGTAHLDREHESKVNASIKSFGITLIVVAHRQETIAAADVVYRLDAGKLEKISSNP
jgi:ATP-binding cassette subfamily B protein RaxB